MNKVAMPRAMKKSQMWRVLFIKVDASPVTSISGVEDEGESKRSRENVFVQHIVN